MWKTSSLILTACLLAATAPAQTNGLFQFASTPQRTALLELYASEGCSSCPPAEKWLTGLQDSPRLWKDFVPLAFHVDYWNYLGWKDAWSDAEFSERQRAFAQLWRSDNIYTPEFILDGHEWHDWFTGKKGPRADGRTAGRLTVSSTDTNRWQAVFLPEKISGARYEIHAVLLAGGIISDVKAGENRGRRLRHDFVVVNLVQLGMATSDAGATGGFILDTPRHRPGRTLALAVWITRVGQLEPLQATGGWLVPPDKNDL
jgi:hypothetical protein